MGSSWGSVASVGEIVVQYKNETKKKKEKKEGRYQKNSKSRGGGSYKNKKEGERTERGKGGRL